MSHSQASKLATVRRDLIAGAVVFVVALPLCLGIALAANAPLVSGLVAGIVGGILVGALSGSHTSVSGPAAGLTAVVAAQIAAIGSFEGFLLALVMAGLIQMAFGLARLGFIAEFFPSSVIKGLLAAIGVLLILKQTPHLFGYDVDPEGDMAFLQPDHRNTFLGLVDVLSHIHLGATVIAMAAIAILLLWSQYKPLKKSGIPAPLVVVMLGVGLRFWFQRLGAPWHIESTHMVEVPIAANLRDFLDFLTFPDFSQFANLKILVGAVTVALVASLETLLNLEAVDRLDPKGRISPPSRELFAQGLGNLTTGLLGGIPITSVIVRSSVNINAGGQTRLAAIVHGCLLLICVTMLPRWLNLIPLSCLAAILFVTGAKLASPKILKKMWDDGRSQFIPFIVTIVAIVLSDLLVGISIGLAVSVGFILNSNLRRPIHRVLEKHLSSDVLHIKLANQVSFLNRAALSKILHEVPRGGHVLIDAEATDYIDPDVAALIRTYTNETAPALQVEVSLVGFRKKYALQDRIEYVDYSTRELQKSLTPEEVLQVLKDGHRRFRSGQRLTRDLVRQFNATGKEQHPLAVILSCIDSRAPAELIFDLGVGDIMSVRVAGNIPSRKVLGSIEFACSVAGAKLVLVMGHTRCGAVSAAIGRCLSPHSGEEASGCQHIDFILEEIQQSIDASKAEMTTREGGDSLEAMAESVARANVQRTVQQLSKQSTTLSRLSKEGKIGILGALYNVESRNIEFFDMLGRSSLKPPKQVELANSLAEYPIPRQDPGKHGNARTEH